MPDIRLKRTPGSNPPATLGPGEPAWVDGTNTLYIGKIDGTVVAITGSNVILLPSIVCTASEAISAGALVNFYGNGQMRNANAATGLSADGFVKTAVASGATGSAYTLNGSSFSPLVEGDVTLVGGSDYYLSATTPGRISASQVASGSGYIHQKIGKPVGNTFIFRPNDPVVRG